jgi:IclR family pca regulon transcriptional regulator
VAVQLNASVIKAFSILSLFSSERREITAGDVAAELQINNVTAYRFLRTLERVGALVMVTKGVYRLGFLLVDLGDRVTHHLALARTLQPVLEAMTNDLNEATMATVFEANMVVCIARTYSRRSLSVDLRVGNRLEAYCTAQGKLWLAQLSEAEFLHYLDMVPRERFSTNTIVDRDNLAAEIDKVRRKGYAVNDSEREEGLRTLALPVKTRGGRMVSGLFMYGSLSSG